MFRKGVVYIAIAIVFMMTAVNLSVLQDSNSDASAWFDGQPLSDAYPNYGIQDIIADEAFKLLKANYPEKAAFIDHWYLADGADNWEDSFDEKNHYPDDHDNFLAYIDGAPEGDRENYFIHNSKGHEDTDAPTYVQKYVNFTIQNLTKWMLNGMEMGDNNHHWAVRWLAWASHLVGDMSQVGHTDYSRWDQYASPVYDPYDGSYQLYYERYIWDDPAMDQLITDFESQIFHIPDQPNSSEIHVSTANLAKWVNSRDQDPVTMVDDPPGVTPETITVGPIYKYVIEQFRYNWDLQKSYKGVPGMNETLWNLTLDHITWAAENLTAFYLSIWDESWSRFLTKAPDVVVDSWSIDPTDPIEGDGVAVTSKIVNQGNTSAEGMIIALRSGGFTSLRPLTLGPGESGNVTFDRFEIGGDRVHFNITSDFRDDVFEKVEDNNKLNGTFVPIPEVHGVTARLVDPINEVRRDTIKEITIEIENTGNRFDLYDINATVTGDGINAISPTEPVGVGPGESGYADVVLITTEETPMGVSALDIDVNGRNESTTISLTINIIGRTNDPVPPNPKEYSWTRVGDNITLTASGWTDPDGDPLTFTWVIPDRDNLTGSSISINYTEVGTYQLSLSAYDGNVSVSIPWTLEVFPQPPENLSASYRPQSAGVEIDWPSWRYGGLISYWLSASAKPGQEEKSALGPFLARYGPGNTSGRVGSFYPGTEIEVELFVEAERFGNRSMFSISTFTNSTDAFDEDFRMSVEDRYLNIYYKPFQEPEGMRIPDIEVTRLFDGEYIPLDVEKEILAQTPRLDTVRYSVGSNTGSYKASLSYYFKGGDREIFTIYEEISIPNQEPTIDLVALTNLWELDDYESEGGESRVRMTLIVNDPGDSLTLTIDWDDGSTENMIVNHTSGMEINHTYNAVGVYDIEINGYDWSGESAYANITIDVLDYKKDEPAWSLEELSPWQIVLIIIIFIIIVVLIVTFGYTGYKFAKKETTVEFDMEEMKKPHEKVGTGTDFDERKKYLIPKESIMGSSKSRRKEEEYLEPEVKDEESEVPIIEGEITFDEE